jgi:hypothetical protein
MIDDVIIRKTAILSDRIHWSSTIHLLVTDLLRNKLIQVQQIALSREIPADIRSVLPDWFGLSSTGLFKINGMQTQIKARILAEYHSNYVTFV